MQLRPYQSDVLSGVYDSWQRGARNVLAVLPTGGGKTVIFSEGIRQHNGGSCAIAHRQELVSQISLALARDEVRHRIIGPNSVIRWVNQLHIMETGRSYYDPSARCAVAGVDTLVRRGDELARWAQQVTLWVQDEAHHLLTGNKWGKAVAMFPNARGLGVTATPERADGKGLGRHADGVFDTMVEGPGMRDLITAEYLTDYRILCPPSDLDLSDVATGSDGDFNRKPLAAKTRKSSVMGDVVTHYLRHASGRLGVTFAPDVETATELAARFNSAGVAAEVVSAKTPEKIRQEILKRFRRREILQLVNVDLFGEGFDLPAIEVVSMARATQSFSLYCLDPETEVLTPNGWAGIRDIDSINRVFAFDTRNGGVKSVPVTGRVKRPRYKYEKMLGIESPHLDICVSDKHDMVVKGRGAKCVNWVKEKAEVTAGRKAMFKVPVSGFGTFSGSGLSNSELSFLGWFLADGSLNRKNNAITISQAANKTNHLNAIRAAIRGCGFKFGEYKSGRKDAPKTHNDLVRFSISHGKPRGKDTHLTGWARLSTWVDKAIPACYDRLTRGEFLVLLNSLNMGDGVNDHSSLDYKKRTLTITCGDNEQMADRLQAMCVVRGLRCNKATQNYAGRGTWFSLHIRDTQTATIAGANVKDGTISGVKEYKRSRFTQRNEAPKELWCLTNELGTLITRRRGKIAVVGNCQQFGRALRILEGKERAIIIDHVGNVLRHGLPDRPRVWSLDRREKRGGNKKPDDVVPMRVCLNPACMAPYERVFSACPFCGHVPTPAGRTAPEQVDGDLVELDPETLAALRGEIAQVDRHPDEVKRMMQKAGHAYPIAKGAANRHEERQRAQTDLRKAISYWAGYQRAAGRPDSESYRRFYFSFGVDVLTAQTLGRPEAEKLTALISAELNRINIDWKGAA